MEVRYQLRYSPETSESEAYPGGNDGCDPDTGGKHIDRPVDGRSTVDPPDPGGKCGGGWRWRLAVVGESGGR